MEKDLQKESIEHLFGIARKVLENWMIILCVALSAAFLTYVVGSALYQPQYTSSTTFVVSAKGSSVGAYANVNSAQKLTDTFQSVLNSQVLKKKVAETLGKESFNGEVRISVLQDTNLLFVSVTSNSPLDAYLQLRGILENYDSVSQTVLGSVVLEVFEEPEFPSRPNQVFQGSRMLKLGFAGGAALSACLLALYYYLRNDICTEQDVADKLDTTLFAALHHEKKYRNLKMFLKRQNKHILITEPSVSFRFVETIKKMRTKLLYNCRDGKSKILLVTSTRAKEGKSVVAANLALALAQRSKKVLLIEGDLRQTKMSDLLEVELPAKAGIGEKLPPAETLGKYIFQKDNSSLYLLLNKEKHTRSAEYFSTDGFKTFLDEMRQEMDYIIIDGPAVRGRGDTEVLARNADVSLLVTRQNVVEAPYINDTIDMLNCYGEGVIGCVLNDMITYGGIVKYGYGYGYGYGKYGYGKYGYGKYGYGKYGYGHYGRTDK